MKARWIVLALFFATPAFAAEMYSWTDANGVKHFSDSPPPANVANAHKLKVSGGVTTTSAPDADKAPDAKAGGPSLAAAAGYSPEDIRHNCDIANKNLTTLGAQKVALNAEGDPVDAAAAKVHQDQVDKANQQIKLFCATK